jgi:transposase-like protein
MPKTSPPYDEEFRRDAIAFYRTSTLPKAQIARELGVSANSLREWDKRDRPTPCASPKRSAASPRKTTTSAASKRS